jgi:hypothetical protein
LQQHDSSNIAQYLSQIGRDARLEGWQFRQVVHGLQLLFTQQLHLRWAADFDWQYWLDAAKELEATHPTVARHNAPLTLVSGSGANPSAAELGRRNYSIREQMVPGFRGI